MFVFAFPLVLLFAFSLLFGAAADDAPIRIDVATKEGDDSLSAGIIAGLLSCPGFSAERLSPEDARVRLRVCAYPGGE